MFIASGQWYLFLKLLTFKVVSTLCVPDEMLKKHKENKEENSKVFIQAVYLQFAIDFSSLLWIRLIQMRDFPGGWRFMVACARCRGWSCEKHIHLMQSVEKRERTELKHTFHIIMQTSVYGVDLVSDLAGSNDAFAQESNFFFFTYVVSYVH